MPVPLWHSLIIAQQQAKSHNGTTTTPKTQQPPPPAAEQNAPLTSKRIDKSNYHLLVGKLDLLELKHAYGEVTALLIKSQSDTFSIIINVDDGEEYQRTWAEMTTLSDDVDSIVASQQGESYILNMSDIQFSKSIKISISGIGITFTKIYIEVKYGKLG